jgi:hypothetical protein
MTIQDWGALGEIISAIAVVASLVYLAVQIRQNTQQISHSIEATRIASLERNIESANRMREVMIVNPGLAELFIQGARDFDALSGGDRLRFEFLLRNIFAAFQGAYVRHRSIGDDPDELRGVARMIESILENPGVQSCFERIDADWRPEFRDFVNERISAINERAEA